MTSKAAISQLEVNERRLKGIYDQLESGNFKKAAAEADKVLKKNPTLLPAKVLKALSLLRLGKSHEALSIINDVVKAVPTDENTLNSLSYFFRENNQKEKIPEIYEEALRSCPNREDICANLFYCYVRSGNFLSQQKIATNLRKLNQKHLEYGMWPIVSNVLHGLYNGDLRLVKLGEAQLSKLFKSSDAILSSERCQFFFFVLDKLDKLTDIIDWLDGETLRDVVENEQHRLTFDRIRMSVLYRLNRKEEFCDVIWRCLENNKEDVLLWRDYIDAVINLDLPDSHHHSVNAAINRLQQCDQHKISTHVAMIHMSIALHRSHHRLSSGFGSKCDKVVEYFKNFGDKPSCLYDIYNFLGMDQHFSNDERMDIVSTLTGLLPELSVDAVQTTKDIERYHLIECVRRAVSHANRTSVDKIIRIYEHCIQLSTSSQDSSVTTTTTEIKPWDNFARLAACYIHDRWTSDNNIDHLFDAADLLRRSIAASPSNHFLKFQLASIYGLLGCSSLLIGQFVDLDIKQMMCDSVGHHFMLPLLQVPSFEQRIDFLKKNVSRRSKNTQDIEEGLVMCYKLGNYARISEIIDFHRDVEASILLKLSEMEILYVNTVLQSNGIDELFESMSSVKLPEIDSSDSELDVVRQFMRLKDLRDFQTVPDFGPYDIRDRSQQQQSFTAIVHWISHRCLIMRMFYGASKLTMETVVKLDKILSDSTITFDNDDCSAYYKVLASCKQQIAGIGDQTLTRIENGCHGNLTEICPEPFSVEHCHQFVRTVISCIDCLLSFHDWFVRHRQFTTGLMNWTDAVVGPIKQLVDSMVCLDTKDNDVVKLLPRLMRQVTVIGECVSVIALTWCLIENMSQPLRPRTAAAGVKRKTKKKRADGSLSVVDGHSDGLRDFLDETNFHRLPDIVIGEIDRVIETVSSLRNQITRICNEHGSTREAVFDGWCTALGDALTLLTIKKKCLGKLQLRDDEETTGPLAVASQIANLHVVEEATG